MPTHRYRNCSCENIFFFYIYTVRLEQFKEICDSVDVEYHKLLGHSKTRWLTLKPSLERILKLFKALKLYFLEQKSVQLF